MSAVVVVTVTRGPVGSCGDHAVGLMANGRCIAVRWFYRPPSYSELRRASKEDVICYIYVFHTHVVERRRVLTVRCSVWPVAA